MSKVAVNDWKVSTVVHIIGFSKMEPPTHKYCSFEDNILKNIYFLISVCMI